MDENLVLGLYTYEYFSDPDKWSEIDIELSRWGDSNNFCSQFCVQPSWISGHKNALTLIQVMAHTQLTHLDGIKE